MCSSWSSSTFQSLLGVCDHRQLRSCKEHAGGVICALRAEALVKGDRVDKNVSFSLLVMVYDVGELTS